MEFNKFIQSLEKKLNLEIEAEGGVCGLDIDGVKADFSSGSDGSEAHETGAFMQDIV